MHHFYIIVSLEIFIETVWNNLTQQQVKESDLEHEDSSLILYIFDEFIDSIL